VAAPTVRAVGTVSDSLATTPKAVATPGGTVVNGEILLAIFEYQTGAGTNHVTATGWTEIAWLSRAAAAGRTDLAVMGKISDGTEGASVSFALAGTINHWMGRMIAIAGHGCTLITDVVGGSTITGGAGAGASPQTNTLTAITTDAVSMVVICGGSGRDIASTTEFSAYTNAGFASITEQMDNMVITGTGGGFCMATGTFAAGGDTGTTTYQQLILYDWNGVQLGIKPAGAAAAGPPFRRRPQSTVMMNFDPWMNGGWS
jgi:hypothetical protein